MVDTLGEELDTVLLPDDQSAPTAMLGGDGFLRIKLLRADLPDDLQPDDRQLETQCAVNVKERVDINGTSVLFQLFPPIIDVARPGNSAEFALRGIIDLLASATN